MLQSALKNHNEKKFVPGGRASHKAPKDACSSVQGTTRDIKKTDWIGQVFIKEEVPKQQHPHPSEGIMVKVEEREMWEM